MSKSTTKRPLPHNNDNEEKDNYNEPPLKKQKRAAIECPYLDQINRKALDFDFEKVCSVTMTNHNVYGCLVCGQYFGGRSKGSPAYFHSLSANHRIFIHLNENKIYCLPDNYEVIDSSLSDIRHNLFPQFSPSDLWALDRSATYSHALEGRDYLPGCIGLNNLNNTDWLNVIVQSLMRVRMLRNHFLFKSHSHSNSNSVLLHRFGELVRKYFNSQNFKDHISPHELLQAVSMESDKQFAIGKRCNPLSFLAFFLNKLHRHLSASPNNKSKQRKSSIISQCFRGSLTVSTYKGTQKINVERKSFLYLSLDLPTMPLFKDEEKNKFIPQIPLQQLLQKFNNEKVEILADGTSKVYKFERLPPYLVIAYKRFHENNFLVEKNSTIINFVLKGLDLRDFVFPSECDAQALAAWKVKKLKKKLKKLGGENVDDIVEKNELIRQIMQRFPSDKAKWKTKYDLIAQVVHEGKEYHKGTSKAMIYHSPNKGWYEMQDLHVQERMPQLVAISEAYIQIWARTDIK